MFFWQVIYIGNTTIIIWCPCIEIKLKSGKKCLTTAEQQEPFNLSLLAIAASPECLFAWNWPLLSFFPLHELPRSLIPPFQMVSLSPSPLIANEWLVVALPLVTGGVSALRVFVVAITTTEGINCCRWPTDCPFQQVHNRSEKRTSKGLCYWASAQCGMLWFNCKAVIDHDT